MRQQSALPTLRCSILSRMDARLLSSICNTASIFPGNSPPKPSRQSQPYLPIRRRNLHRPASSSTNSSSGGGEDDGDTASANSNTNDTSTASRQRQRQPPSPPNIRYVSRSKRRAKQRREGQYRPPPPPPPKKWEEMTLGEKAVELYVGEKGLLFWLNKFAYASIFIIIGGWILFRFVGPALNLYQLDGPLLSPDSVFKGS